MKQESVERLSDKPIQDSYEALPLPPASRLQPETFFRYCADTERAYPERLVVYIYRMQPIIDRSRTGSPKNIWVGGVGMGGGGAVLNEEWLITTFGSGGYKVMACDPLRPGKGHKTLCYAYVNFEDWDEKPPVLDFRELMQGEKKNARYVQWLQGRGVQLPEEDQMGTTEAVKELADLVRDVKDNGNHTAAAIVDAVKTGVQLAGAGGGPSLREILEIVDRLRPPAPVADSSSNLLTAVLPLVQAQMKQAEERAAAQAAMQAKQFELLMQTLRASPTSTAPQHDEVTQAILGRAVAKVLDQMDNPAPAGDGWMSVVPIVAEAAKSVANSLAMAWMRSEAPVTAITAARPPATTPPPPAAPPPEESMKQRSQPTQPEVSPYVLAIADSLLHHLEHYDGAQFAAAFMSFHGRVKWGMLRQLGAEQLFTHIWSHPAVRAFGEASVRQFITEFLAWDPEVSD